MTRTRPNHNRRSPKKSLIGCGIPVIGLVALVYFGVRAYSRPPTTAERSELVARGDVDVEVVETGTVEPLHTVEVKSKVGGRILKLYVDEGAFVWRGQMIARIDPIDINSQVAALRSQLAAAQARVASARKGADFQQSQTTTSIDQYVHNLAAARARLASAETEANAQPVLTRQAVDMAQANLDAANAAYAAQQQSLNLLVRSTHPNNVASAQSAYDQARAQAANSRKNLERQRQLAAQGFISQQSVDAAVADSAVADAHETEVKEKLDRIKETNALEEANARSQVANALGTVNQMKAALAQAKSSTLPSTKLSDLENARAAYAQAKAQLDAARSGRTQDMMRKDDASAAAADAQQIKNQLDQVLVQMHDTTIFAPLDGVVTKRYVEQGELITSAIGSFSQGNPIFQISDLTTMLVKINVNEVDIARVKPLLPVEVRIDASKQIVVDGHVRKVAPAALDTTAAGQAAAANSQAVVRFPVEIQVDRADQRLKPGMSARCTIYIARRRNVVRVPANCVRGDGERGTVTVVTSTSRGGKTIETATERNVTVGVRGEDFVEILTGLKPGERVRPLPFAGPPRRGANLNIGD